VVLRFILFPLQVAPFVVFPYQIHKTVNGLVFWDVKFDWRFAHIEVDFAWCAAHIAEVSVCHFSRAVDYASHDSDFHALEVLCAGFDFGYNGL